MCYVCAWMVYIWDERVMLSSYHSLILSLDKLVKKVDNLEKNARVYRGE